MKKILLSLLAVMISFTALAQTDGDKITINNSEGKQAEWNLTGESSTISPCIFALVWRPSGTER